MNIVFVIIVQIIFNIGMYFLGKIHGYEKCSEDTQKILNGEWEFEDK